MHGTILTVIMIYVHYSIAGYIEKVVVGGCESCQLMLTCRKLDSIIAILDTDFKAEIPVFDSEFVKNKTMIFPPDHPRDALNKRCSGLNHCSFILTQDSPGSEAYGAGNISVKYACVTQDKVQRYCNSEIKLNDEHTSGLLHNPGYPRFYAGQLKCFWKILAPPYQRINLRMLDIALFDTVSLSEEDCKDTLEVIDTGQVIYSTCSQEHPPSEVVSASESIEIVLTSRQIINPRRGILIYYTLEGCPPPLPPKDGYLVSHNESIATYTCCQGYVFPDTQTKSRTILCVGALWNISLPLLDCAKPEISKSINLLEVVKRTEMASDLVAPIALMLVLFALNGVVVYYIRRAKQKQLIEPQDEELGTFSENKN